ncbi:MAG: hypothetical protein IJU19_04055 [Bacteroidales bacterium]|nr:hypothetical protein [Bacteroidales bacterium]
MSKLNSKNWAAWLFLPDYMIMQRLTEGRLQGNSYWVFLLKYLVWFLVGDVMCAVVAAAVGRFSWWVMLAVVAVSVLGAAIYAAFSRWHVKDNAHFKEKYGNKQ